MLVSVSYTHLRAHETVLDLVCRLLLEKKPWIIDCFKENNYPLEIAEIELSNEEEDLILPSFISREITGLTHYSNFGLANNPFSKWEEEFLQL